MSHAFTCPCGQQVGYTPSGPSSYIQCPACRAVKTVFTQMLVINCTGCGLQMTAPEGTTVLCPACGKALLPQSTRQPVIQGQVVGLVQQQSFAPPVPANAPQPAPQKKPEKDYHPERAVPPPPGHQNPRPQPKPAVNSNGQTSDSLRFTAAGPSEPQDNRRAEPLPLPDL